MEFNKFSWIHELPEVFENGKLTTKRLAEISDESRKKLVFLVMKTLMKYFNCSDAYAGSSKDPTERAVEFESQITTWLSGLVGVSVAQIIHALDDILELRTDYQKYPPKSVIEFHAVCKMPRPAYHDRPRDPSNAPQLEWDKKAAREKTVKTAHECLIKIYKRLKGKDYLVLHEQKKKDGVYGKEMREEWGKENNCSATIVR